MNYFVCHTSQATVLKNLAEKSLSPTGLANKVITETSQAYIRPETNLKLGSGQVIAGDIASDLYGPQFWDDNFQFSFSVVVSCKSNKQLGYF